MLLVPGEDHLTLRHAAHLRQAGIQVGPVVDGHDRHGGIEGLVGEGERLRSCLNTASLLMLGEHHRCRLNGYDLFRGRFVRPRARSDIDNRPDVAQCFADYRRQARVGLAKLVIPDADPIVGCAHSNQSRVSLGSCGARHPPTDPISEHAVRRTRALGLP